jgi:hypothetical protein
MRRSIIVVEVLSEGTAARDHGSSSRDISRCSASRTISFSMPNRIAIHHKRGLGAVIETRILKEGQLRLDPPGLEIPVQDLFPPAYPAPDSLSEDERASERPATEEGAPDG